MTLLKPTQNSQKFKKLYTDTLNRYDKLRKKSDLCRDYCDCIDMSHNQAKSGQHEYKRFNFDSNTNVPLENAQKILSLYIDHINKVETQLKKAIFSKEDISNISGLRRRNNNKISSILHWIIGKENLEFGNIHIDLEKFYYDPESAKKDNQSHNRHKTNEENTSTTFFSWVKYNNLNFLVIFITAVACVFYYDHYIPDSSSISAITNIEFLIEENYTYKHHRIILEGREKAIREKLRIAYNKDIRDKEENDLTIKILEGNLASVQSELSTSSHIMVSYRSRIIFLKDRNKELEGIRHRVTPGLYQEAELALIKGDTSKAYELYQQFKVEAEPTIQQVAIANYERGLINESNFLYKIAFTQFERATELHPQHFDYLYKTGNMAHILNYFDKAVSYYEQALTVSQTENNPNDIAVALLFNDMGHTWRAIGKFKQALEYYNKALQIYTKKYGEDHPQVAVQWNNLGEVWQELGEYTAAIDSFEKSLRINIQSYGYDHHDVALVWFNLSMTLRDLGSFEKSSAYNKKAIAYFENILPRKVELLGDSHPQIIFYQNKLGMSWQLLGDPKKAIDHMEKSLTGNIQTFGENHLSVAQDWNNLGSAWELSGNYHKASTYYEKSYKLISKYLGDQHPTSITISSNIKRTKSFMEI